MLELMFLIVLAFHNPNIVLQFIVFAFVVFLAFSIYTGAKGKTQPKE